MKKTKQVTLTAEINIMPGFEEEVLEATKKIWTETRKEPGCEFFVFNTKQSDGKSIVLFEAFKSHVEFEAHLKADYTVNFIAFLKGKVIGDGPKLTILDNFEI